MNLKQFDDKPIKKNDGGFTNPLASVPDGDYEVEVTGYSERAAPGGLGGAIVTIATINNNGQQMPKECWITSDEKMGEFLGVLDKMGFDVDNWTVEKNRPRSEEAEKALKCAKGMRLKVTKTTDVSKKDAKTYHNLKVLGRVANDGKPNPVPVEYLNEVGGDPFA